MTEPAKTEPIASLTIERPHDPSWEVPGYREPKGRMQLEVQLHRRAGWLQLRTTEYGSKSAKTTFVTLTPAEAYKVRDLLVEALGAYEKAQEDEWKKMQPYRNKAEEHARSYDYEGEEEVMRKLDTSLLPGGTSWCVPETGKVYHVEDGRWEEMPDSDSK